MIIIQRHWFPFHPHVLNLREKSRTGETISQLSRIKIAANQYHSARNSVPSRQREEYPIQKMAFAGMGRPMKSVVWRVSMLNQTQCSRHGNKRHEPPHPFRGADSLHTIEHYHRRGYAEAYKIAERVKFLSETGIGVQGSGSESVEKIGDRRDADENPGPCKAVESPQRIAAAEGAYHRHHARDEIETSDPVRYIFYNCIHVDMLFIKIFSPDLQSPPE